MAAGLLILPLADRLRRAAYVERISIMHLCGWFVAAPPYELKHRLGYHAWNHAEHVQWLQERLQFLRGGRAGPNLDPALVAFINLTREAPDVHAYIRGAYLVLKQALLDHYEETLSACDPAANAYDARMLRRIIPELEEQIEWARHMAEHDPNPQQSAAWSNDLQAVLNAIGGLAAQGTGSRTVDHPLARRFTMPDRIVFDDRIADLPLMAHDEKTRLPYEEAVREQFRVFFNEIYAASMLATILYDAYEHDLPWAFTYDFARHFWDEVRHSEFGAIRLKELGHEPDRCNQTLFLNGMAMPLLHRVCYLTLILEPYYMPRKKPRFEEYGTAGDERSQLFADHDWSDEINHVRLGKDWLERLLEDDARDIRQLKVETREILARVSGEGESALSPF
jgi:hypothetical protein